jgi:hypothetical protein
MTDLEQNCFNMGRASVATGKGLGAQYTGSLRQAWSYGKLCGLAETGAVLQASQYEWLGFYEEKFSS